jgi:transcription elongation factor Elf1
MIKCPHCNKELIIDYGSDVEATMWNFDGESSDVEMILYCENCEELCEVEIHYNMIPTKIKRISKR